MRVYVAGHRGMVGGAITRKLRERGAEVICRTHAELDLEVLLQREVGCRRSSSSKSRRYTRQ
jgi:nucleoside-diphosphate-sugar epimerase